MSKSRHVFADVADAIIKACADRQRRILVFVRRFRPQDDIAALVRGHVQVAGRKTGLRSIDQIIKINILPALQHRAVFNGNLARPQHDAAAGVNLSLDCDILVRVRIKFDTAGLELAGLLPFGFPGTKLGEIVLCSCRHIIRPVPQLEPVVIPGNQRRKLACVDYTGLAHHHTIGAEEIQVAVNLPVFHGVHHTVDGNTFLHQINQILHRGRQSFLVKMHIGDMPIIKAEFFKLVDTYHLVRCHLLDIHIVHAAVHINDAHVAVSPCNIRGPGTGRQQDSRKYQRYDPPGCRTGADYRLPACSRSLMQGRRHLQHGSLHARSQLADYTPCIILTVVLGDFRYHHVTFPGVAPNDLENLIHNPTPVKLPQE